MSAQVRAARTAHSLPDAPCKDAPSTANGTRVPPPSPPPREATIALVRNELAACVGALGKL